jgi:hypothetical protein
MKKAPELSKLLLILAKNKLARVRAALLKRSVSVDGIEYVEVAAIRAILDGSVKAG